MQEEEKGDSLVAAAGGPQSFGNPAKATKKKRLRKKHVSKRER